MIKNIKNSVCVNMCIIMCHVFTWFTCVGCGMCVCVCVCVCMYVRVCMRVCVCIEGQYPLAECDWHMV